MVVSQDGMEVVRDEIDGPAASAELLGAKLAVRMLERGAREIVEALEKFCALRGRKLIELAFAWLLAHPAVSSVIAGASTPAQVDDNVRAAAGWILSAQDLAEIDRRIDHLAEVLAVAVVAHQHLAVARAARDLELGVDAEVVIVRERVVQLVLQRPPEVGLVRAVDQALGRER